MTTMRQALGLNDVSTKFTEAVEKSTFIMQAYYRMLRREGFSRADAKNIIEQALKCGIVNESFGDGVDVED